MFKNRSPFAPSCGPKKRFENAMSLEKNEKEVKKEVIAEKPASKVRQIVTTLPTASNLCERKYCFVLKDPLAEDNTVYWMTNLGNQVSNEYSRKLIFREQEYCLRGIDEGGIANTIYVCAEGVPGYLDSDSIVTDRVCALHLSHMSIVVDDVDQKIYDIIYKQTQDVIWDIPMDLAQLKFRIMVDETELEDSLSIPLVCQFDIRHIGK